MIDTFFSEDYSTSRTKFREAVVDKGGIHRSWEHPSETDFSGDALSIDVAILGDPSAHNVAVNINGTHGNESYAGAAAQLQFLEEFSERSLAPHTFVILIHCLNPYGWLHDSQLNEDLVNLNRNFIDFNAIPESDELHQTLEARISFQELSFKGLAQAWDQYLTTVEEYGEARFNSAFMCGQHNAPQSINYGGREAGWSNGVLREIAEEYVSQVKCIGLLDWHTGLGKYGQPHELPLWQPNTDSWQMTERWWGKEAMDLGSAGVIGGGDPSTDASASMFTGLAYRAFAEAAPNARIAGGIVEFGTTLFPTMIQGCILDTWLMFNDLYEHPEYRFWKSLSREVLAPKDPVWRQSILTHAREFYRKTLEGLAELEAA